MTKNDQYRPAGIVTTLIFHGILIGLFLYYGFTTPLPLPAEQGILVNFGNDLQGSGAIEPKFSETNIPPVEEKTESEEVKDQGQLTQDFEEAPVVKAVEKKKEEKKKTDKPIVKKPQVTTKTTTKPEPVKEERKPNPMALYQGRGSETSTSTNEGIAGGTGNQGNPTGSPDSKNYANISSTGGGGISAVVGNRSSLSLPFPDYKCSTDGLVIVEITVDKEGNVTKAIAGAKGSTTLDNCLLDAAKRAALLSKFNRNADAPTNQKGTISYRFKLQ